MKTKIDIENLLQKMSIREKIGQMVQVNANMLGNSTGEATGPIEQLGISKDFTPYIGSTLNFHGAAEVVDIQSAHLSQDPNQIPLLFMMDVIHGYRTIYPIPLAMGGSFDPSLLMECSQMAAKEAAAAGVHCTFTPMVDLVRDARWGRVMETCGEDAYMNSVMGAVQVKAFQGEDLSDPEHLATCVKHFAAYGGAEAGRDYNTVEISERMLRECYLPAYRACLDAGCRMIMPSFNSLNGVPAVGNKWLMREILKKEWQFDGIVISDYNAINELIRHGVAENEKHAAGMAFSCGCDIDMMSPIYYRYLEDLIQNGVFTEKQLDDAVRKILQLKQDMGLFEDPYHGASPEKEAAVCLTDAHRAIARRAAEESAVLLKNNGVLPFSVGTKKIALIGPFAASKEIKGFWACDGKDEECVSVAEGIQRLLPDAEILIANGCSARWDDDDRSGFEHATDMARVADAVILCVGEPQNYSGEGNSRADLELPGVQMEMAKQVIAANPNTAVVTFSGRPLVLTELDAIAPAILHMWFPGTEGGNAAANLLFGVANPSAKVSMSFPKAVGQCPIYYNHPITGRPKKTPENVHQGYASNYIGCGNLPLYSFGHGLSYSKFVYESMTLDIDRIKEDQEIHVEITVMNDSDRAGKEVVQLYLHDLVASTVRPIQSLIGFKKLSFEPHERKTVSFTVREPQLRFYNADCEFVSEAGEFTLSTGYADHLLLTQHFFMEK